MSSIRIRPVGLTHQKTEQERKVRKQTVEKRLETIYQRLKDQHKLSKKTIEHIAAVYRGVPHHKFSPKHQDCLLCAIIIVGSHQAKEPVTFGEAQIAVGLTLLSSPRKGDRLARMINKKVRNLYRDLGKKMVPANPLEYVDRFCLKTGLSKEVAEASKDIIGERGADGLMPSGIAVAAISLAADNFGRKLLITDLGKIFGVTCVTIRKGKIKLIEENHSSFFVLANFSYF
ncbi:MAG: hypothetical protein ABH919_02045 [bacterium]